MPESPFPSLARVELTRTVNVKFDVQKLLDEFPNEWREWQEDGDPNEPDVQGFVRETLAEIGWEILDYNEWVIPEPMYDGDETDVRFEA